MKRLLLPTILGIAMAALGPAAGAHATPSSDGSTGIAMHRLPAHTLSATKTAAVTMGPSAGVWIYNWATGRCIDLPGQGPGHPGGPVNQYQCASGDNQDFTFVQYAPGLWWIKNDKDGLCLDLPGTGRVAANTKVIEYTCAATDNQFWSGRFRFSVDYISGTVNGFPCPTARAGVDCFDFYWLRNFYWNGSGYVESGLCLEVPGPATGGDNVQLAVYYCSDGDDHDWTWF